MIVLNLTVKKRNTWSCYDVYVYKTVNIGSGNTAVV